MSVELRLPTVELMCLRRAAIRIPSGKQPFPPYVGFPVVHRSPILSEVTVSHHVYSTTKYPGRAVTSPLSLFSFTFSSCHPGPFTPLGV
jgi:hypothetical protein